MQNANRGYLQSLDTIGINLKSIDDNARSGLNTIGSNVQDNKDTSESVLDSIAASIRDFTSTSNDLNQRIATNVANLDKSGKTSMSELMSTIKSFDSLSEISNSNLNIISENIKNMDRNSERLLDSFKTSLVNTVSNLGNSNKDELVKISQSLQSAGDGYLTSLKEMSSNIKLLDEHSYATLTNIAKNMETVVKKKKKFLSRVVYPTTMLQIPTSQFRNQTHTLSIIASLFPTTSPAMTM